MSFALLALVLAAPLAPDAGTPATLSATGGLFSLIPENPLEGSKLFADKGCITCHTVQSSGGRGGPDLGRGMMNRPLLEIAGVMWNHSRQMQHAMSERHIARPKFKAQEMANLLAFLYYLGSFDDPGDPAVGERLFKDRQCARCHSVAGAGGHVGPKLDKFAGYASPLYFTSAVWNAGPKMSQKMKEENIERPTFSGKDIPDLLAFIRREGGDLDRVYARPGNPRRGEALFGSKGCTQCHAINGKGPRVGPDLGQKLRGSLTQVAGAMWNHGPTMWSKMAEKGIKQPDLSPEEAADLVSFLYYLQFIDPPGDARRGEQIFKDSKCAGCHETEGKKAPVLDDQRFESSLEIVAAMWNHGAQMEKEMAEANVAWPVLKRGEMADLMAYLARNRAE